MKDTFSNSPSKLGRGSMYETPENLVVDQIKDLKNVRSLGLGFAKTTLDPQIYARLMHHFRSNIHQFKSEPSDGFIKTENLRAFPSLIYQDEAFNQRLMGDLHRPMRRGPACGSARPPATESASISRRAIFTITWTGRERMS